MAEETIDFILRDMRDAAGGFYTALDADSEGEEGIFYIWSRAEILERLGNEAGERFCDVYGVTDGGNFEGANILFLPQELSKAAIERGRHGGAAPGRSSRPPRRRYSPLGKSAFGPSATRSR